MMISPVSSAAVQHQQQITPQQVSAKVVKQADSDGDGRTGVAALNDGDAAARTAAQQVKQGRVDVRA